MECDHTIIKLRCVTGFVAFFVRFAGDAGGGGPPGIGKSLSFTMAFCFADVKGRVRSWMKKWSAPASGDPGSMN